MHRTVCSIIRYRPATDVGKSRTMLLIVVLREKCLQCNKRHIEEMWKSKQYDIKNKKMWKRDSKLHDVKEDFGMS